MNISHKSTGALEQTRFEKIHSVIFNDSKEASKIVAKEIEAIDSDNFDRKKLLDIYRDLGRDD